MCCSIEDYENETQRFVAKILLSPRSLQIQIGYGLLWLLYKIAILLCLLPLLIANNNRIPSRLLWTDIGGHVIFWVEAGTHIYAFREFYLRAKYVKATVAILSGSLAMAIVNRLRILDRATDNYFYDPDLTPKSDAMASAVMLSLYLVFNSAFIVMKAMEIGTKYHYLKWEATVSSLDEENLFLANERKHTEGLSQEAI